MTTQTRPIKVLGEIAFRVKDLDRMQKFYEEVVGLELMRCFPGMAFFKIAEGYGGHTQILALFDRTAEPNYAGIEADKTSVDHIAFTIDLTDFESERRRLEQLDMKIDTTTHAWVKWRSLYFSDPEGNRVEFVCYDEGVS